MIRPSKTVPFDFENLADVKERLAELAVEVPPPSSEYGTRHLRPLKLLGDAWNVSPEERRLYEKLAQGYTDLLVVLTEPVERHSNLDADQVIETSPCLVALNDHIRLATNGTRDIHNTCVFNARPYYNQDLEESRPESTAYSCFWEMVSLLAPSVSLVTQCKIRKPAGTTWLSNALYRQDVRDVNTFNPSCFVREDHVAEWVEERFSANLKVEIDLRKRILEALFQLSCLRAFNALTDRMVGGCGFQKLLYAKFHNRLPTVETHVDDADGLGASLSALHVNTPSEDRAPVVDTSSASGKDDDTKGNDSVGRDAEVKTGHDQDPKTEEDEETKITSPKYESRGPRLRGLAVHFTSLLVATDHRLTNIPFNKCSS
ncbi:hypothetical protein MBLNU457_5274t1 [Dothideomycetes sp. NU457]